MWLFIIEDTSCRGLAGGQCQTSSSEANPARDKFTNGTIINRSMPLSLASGSDIGKDLTDIRSHQYLQLVERMPYILNVCSRVKKHTKFA